LKACHCRSTKILIQLNFKFLSKVFKNNFLILAAFCWMNVMAYDVYKTFAKPNSSFKKQSLSNNSLKCSQNHNFRLYSLYAWLLPAVILIISIIVQTVTPFDSPYSPAYGRTTCGISHFKAMLIYFMFPVSIILTLNVILFIITVRKLKLIVKETRFATKKRAKSQLLLHIKLVLVLGLTWIFWFIAVFTEIPLFTYPSILLHGLHGAFIFVAFTVKKNVYRLIVSRIKYLRGEQQIHISVVMADNARRRAVGSIDSSRSNTVITLWSDKVFRERYASIWVNNYSSVNLSYDYSQENSVDAQDISLYLMEKYSKFIF